MNRPDFAGVILLSLASLAMSGCGRSGGGSTSTGSIVAFEPFFAAVPVAAHERLRVVGVSGVIEIRGNSAATSVSISAMKKVSSSSLRDAQSRLGGLNVLVTEEGPDVVVQTEQPPGVETQGRDYVVEYTITIPSTMRVHSSQANGETSILGTNSDLAASQANGPIVVDAVLPPGGIIDLGTANGDIALAIPAGTSATLSCRSGTGTVSYSGLTVLNPVQTRNSLSGTLGGGDGTITAASANGDIALLGGR